MPQGTSTSDFANAIMEAIYGNSSQQEEEAKKEEEEAKKEEEEGK